MLRPYANLGDGEDQREDPFATPQGNAAGIREAHVRRDEIGRLRNALGGPDGWSESKGPRA